MQEKGRRLTKARRAMLAILVASKTPLAVSEILDRLAQEKILVHKTTIYRELENLLSEKIIESVEFGDGQKRYEVSGEHHHHVICRKCDSVADVYLEGALSRAEKTIAKQTAYKEISHALEFFGLCKACR